MTPIAFALLYFIIGVLFCGLLDERDVPGLLILTWPLVFVLWMLAIVYRIGKEIGKRLRHER